MGKPVLYEIRFPNTIAWKQVLAVPVEGTQLYTTYYRMSPQRHYSWDIHKVSLRSLKYVEKDLRSSKWGQAQCTMTRVDRLTALTKWDIEVE